MIFRRARPTAWRMSAAQQATGSPVSRWSARRRSRGRTTLTLGWRLLSLVPPREWWGTGGEVCVTRRGGLARPTANLVFAGRSRACLQSAGRCPRLETLQPWTRPTQRPNGELSCHGGAPARHEDLAHRWPMTGWSDGTRQKLGDHLGVEVGDEPAGDGRHHHPPHRLALVEGSEPPAQVYLGRPGTGLSGGGDVVLATSQGHPQAGSIGVGPGGLDQLAAQMGVAGMSERPPTHAVTGGVLRGHQSAERAGGATVGEAAPVTDLSLEHQSAQAVD